jgi:hypothetical protein
MGSGAARFEAVVRDESIRRGDAKARYPGAGARVVHPIDPEAFFVRDPAGGTGRARDAGECGGVGRDVQGAKNAASTLREGWNEMKARVLAAGKGTRLLPITGVIPKPMAPVAGRIRILVSANFHFQNVEKIPLTFVHLKFLRLVSSVNPRGGGAGGGGPAVTQSSDQSGERADINQDFSVTGSGSNGNQCANIQGVGNTGNAQNDIALIQYASTADEFDLEEVGSTIDVSTTNSTQCTGAVEHAASASG